MKITINDDGMPLHIVRLELRRTTTGCDIKTTHDKKGILDSVTTDVYCEGVKVIHSSLVSFDNKSHWSNAGFVDGTYGITLCIASTLQGGI